MQQPGALQSNDQPGKKGALLPQISIFCTNPRRAPRTCMLSAPVAAGNVTPFRGSFAESVQAERIRSAQRLRSARQQAFCYSQAGRQRPLACL